MSGQTSTGQRSSRKQMRNVKHLERLQRSHYNNECFFLNQHGQGREDCKSGTALVISQSCLHWDAKNAAWTHLKFYDDSVSRQICQVMSLLTS